MRVRILPLAAALTTAPVGLSRQVRTSKTSSTSRVPRLVADKQDGAEKNALACRGNPDNPRNATAAAIVPRLPTGLRPSSNRVMLGWNWSSTKFVLCWAVDVRGVVPRDCDLLEHK